MVVVGGGGVVVGGVVVKTSLASSGVSWGSSEPSVAFSVGSAGSPVSGRDGCWDFGVGLGGRGSGAVRSRQPERCRRVGD